MREINDKTIHFVGVNGSSICGLIRIAKYLGAKVSGSDVACGENILALQSDGFDVYCGENPEYAKKADWTVYSSAVPEDNPERVAAKDKQMERGVFLGILSQCFEKTVAIAGTHGKTTVTSMVAHVLFKTKQSFCSHAGGNSINSGSGIYTTGRKIFLTEACEYKDNFLSLKPEISVITSIEFDHPDYYPNMDAITQSYKRFAKSTTKVLITGKGVCDMLMCADTHVRTLALDRDFEIVCQNAHIGTFVYQQKKVRSAFAVRTKGEYNLTNCALSLAVLSEIGISMTDCAEALISFEGISRRREYLGKYKGADVYSDYAHHPSQIKALAESFKDTNKKTMALFEPHTYSRTQALCDDFATALSLFDEIVLLPVYGAREKYNSLGTSELLLEKINNDAKLLCKNYSEATSYLVKADIAGSVILFIGAGGIGYFAKNTVHEEKNKTKVKMKETLRK